jgi:release factor glutamine methyltransferase
MIPSKEAAKTVGDTLDGLVLRLEKTSGLPGLDGQLLLAHLLDRPRSWVLAHPEVFLTEIDSSNLEVLVTRLESGEPLPYIIGHWEFYGLEFNLTPEVLIPRPETELLVERAITWLKDSKPGMDGMKVLDLCTGSGCIAISLAVHIPGLSITATDISSTALEVARSNAKKYSVSGYINFLKSDLFQNPNIPDSFSIIVANPPYIPTNTLLNIPVYGHEPTLALDGGSDGLGVIRSILAETPKRLLPGGLLLVEIEASEGPSVLLLASDTFPRAKPLLHKDLAGHDRLLEVKL